jgi:ATP-dependent DNA helicase RecQ
MPSPAASLDDLKGVIERHWGFRTFRPLQEQAMRAVLDGRDSLVVLPTGGGKSLCYQAPAVLRRDTTVVISPLIALMKDQVDGLRACGIAAASIDSSQSAVERSAYERDVLQGAVRLLFISPERLVLTDFYQLLRRIDVRTFAIDEAHCISHWGHDFRQEYRQLNRIRELFPQAAVHAYTATATEQVRRDICSQLGLRDPEVLVGNFDRPNLTYRVLSRNNSVKQALEVIDRHPREAGIIYCLRRRDVDELADALRKHGCKALPYHAGLSAEERRSTQEEFAAERCDLIVATVAFGMGIDRSNIRFVLHTAMPKSVEHYQQETGRAGRDGLEAECVLLHSGGDLFLWKSIVEKSAAEAPGGVDPAFLTNAQRHLDDMDRYCRGAVCRHRALVQYFGQAYEAENCHACDLCLGDTEEVADAVVLAQKILSCVARVKERFGIGHVVGVLRGENTERIRNLGHDQLSTYGLLRDRDKTDIREWIYQLIGQQVLVQAGDEYPILRLNEASWEVMRKQRAVRLFQRVRRKKGEQAPKSKADTVSWEGVDRGLFNVLHGLRRQLADQQQVPAYIVFTDATLRELARVRPSTPERMRLVSGVGDAKLRAYGERFVQAIRDHCQEAGLLLDQSPGLVRTVEARPPSSRPNPQRTLAFELFREGAAIEDVMHQSGRSRSTVVDYLGEFIREERPKSIAAWVSADVYQRVAAAARQFGTERLKPLFIALGEKVSYDEIRLVVTHLTAMAGEQRSP